jgi:hypothetical protein
MIHGCPEQLEPWLADCRMQYWEHFKNEERNFFEHQQHQEREDKVEEEAADEVIHYHDNENKFRATGRT